MCRQWYVPEKNKRLPQFCALIGSFCCSRALKIRCDSTQPVCNHCVRRSNECQYDAAPKRRGPDKRPSTRQRSCKKRPADGSAPPPLSKRKRSGGGVQLVDNGMKSAVDFAGGAEGSGAYAGGEAFSA